MSASLVYHDLRADVGQLTGIPRMVMRLAYSGAGWCHLHVSVLPGTARRKLYEYVGCGAGASCLRAQ